MKTKVPITLFLIYFFISGLAFAQSFEKIIEYDPDYKIIDITSSNNYYCITLKANDQNYIAEVFDKNGAKIFSQKSRKIIAFAYVLEPENYIVLITDEYNDIEGIHLMARAYSIENGQLRWETKFYSGPYELSPNGRMLLNKNQSSADEGTGPFSILNMTDGTIRSFPELSKFGHSAAWLGNSKIVLVKKQWIENPKYLEYRKEVERKSCIIREEMKKLTIDYHNGKISLDKYKAMKTEKVIEMSLLRNGKGEGRGKRIDKNNLNKPYVNKPNKYVQTASKFTVFDIESATIVTNLELLDAEGKSISVSIHNAGAINTDKNGNIYIFGNTMPFNNKLGYGDRIFKLDEKGRVEWSTSKQTQKGTLKLIRFNMSELFFVFENADGFSIVNNQNGELIKESEISNDIKKKINFRKGQYNRYKFNTFSNLALDKSNNKIIIYGKEK